MATKKKPLGRPAGRKNNATLMKESEIAKALKTCQGTAALEAPAIIMAMARKAKEGDVSAAKLILDRVYPAMRQSEDTHKGAVSIQINIVGEENAVNTYEGETEQRESGPANGKELAETEGITIVTEHGGEEGERSH